MHLSLPELIAVVAGAALLLAAAARACVAHWLVRRALAAGVHDTDPAVRAAAVRAAVQDGISRHARLLETLTVTETDPVVLRALAEAVNQHRWEPVTSREMLRLRMWAVMRAQQAARQLPGSPFIPPNGPVDLPAAHRSSPGEGHRVTAGSSRSRSVSRLAEAPE